MINKIDNFLKLAETLKNETAFLDSIESASAEIIKSIKNNGKLLVCGNGGSATQASHLVGEFIGRFGFDRPALPAISLFDLATTTAIGNDYGYEDIFSRFVDGIGSYNDILFSLSTSGNSSNCLKAMNSAKSKGMFNIALLGKDGGKMKEFADIAIIIPTNETPMIQEFHLMVIHQICQNVENYFFKK